MDRSYLSMIICASGLVLLFSCTTYRGDPAITTTEISGHITFLASDSLKGRFPGTPEDEVAAEYIAQEFKKAGLKWFSDNGLQAFEITTDLSYGNNNYFETGSIKGVLQDDFAPFPFSSSVITESEV